MDLVNTFVEVKFNNSDNFLKVQETLSRIGIPSYSKRTVYQSCHILHKRGKYYIVHFKEMFALDGRQTTFDDNDRLIRNKIASLLEDWGLVEIITPGIKLGENIKVTNLQIVSFKDKKDGIWKLDTKYNIGKKHRNLNTSIDTYGEYTFKYVKAHKEDCYYEKK